MQETESKRGMGKSVALAAIAANMATYPYVLSPQSAYYDILKTKPNRFKKSSTYGTGKRIEVRTEQKIGRNEICPKCDSGLKFKKCCIDKE